MHGILYAWRCVGDLTWSWLKMGDELAIMGMWWPPACDVTTWCCWCTPDPDADTSCFGPGEPAVCSGTRCPPSATWCACADESSAPQTHGTTHGQQQRAAGEPGSCSGQAQRSSTQGAAGKWGGSGRSQAPASPGNVETTG